MSRPLPNPALIWFGVLGAPAAWVVQFLAGYALTEADCNRPGRAGDLPIDALTLALTVTAAAIAAAAGLAAVAAFRATRDAGEAPPGGRVHFLSIVGVTLTPLFLAIIVMSGVGVVLLEECRQG